MEYGILSGKKMLDLVKMANDALEDERETVGGPFLDMSNQSDPKEHNYFQAMIKRDKKIKLCDLNNK